MRLRAGMVASVLIAALFLEEAENTILIGEEGAFT